MILRHQTINAKLPARRSPLQGRTSAVSDKSLLLVARATFNSRMAQRLPKDNRVGGSNNQPNALGVIQLSPELKYKCLARLFSCDICRIGSSLPPIIETTSGMI